MTDEPATTISDTFTRSGATRLALDVEKFWKAKGKRVTAWVDEIEDLGLGKQFGGKRLYCVRSDMVGGMPKVGGVTL